MPAEDPYAKYGGSSEADPYAKFGGKMDVPGMEKLGPLPGVSADSHRPEALTESREAATPLMRLGGRGLPVDFRTAAKIQENVNQAGRGVAGLTGDHPKAGAADIIEGLGGAVNQAAMPLYPAMAGGAPVATLKGLLGSLAGSKLASVGTGIAGGDEESQRLAGDVGGLAGLGAAAARLGTATPESYNAMSPGRTLPKLYPMLEKVPIAGKFAKVYNFGADLVNGASEPKVVQVPGRPAPIPSDHPLMRVRDVEAPSRTPGQPTPERPGWIESYSAAKRSGFKGTLAEFRDLVAAPTRSTSLSSMAGDLSPADVKAASEWLAARRAGALAGDPNGVPAVAARLRAMGKDAKLSALSKLFEQEPTPEPPEAAPVPLPELVLRLRKSLGMQ